MPFSDGWIAGLKESISICIKLMANEEKTLKGTSHFIDSTEDSSNTHQDFLQVMICAAGAMDDYTALHTIDDPKLSRIFLEEGSLPDYKSIQEIGSAMDILTKVDLGLAYSSEKLVNLEALLTFTFNWENNFKQMTTENDNISLESIENALTLELLSTILDSELSVLNNFLGAIEAMIIDARQKTSSYVHSRDLFTLFEGKVHDSEESLKQSQDHFLEMKMQLAKLQMNSLTFNHNPWKYNWNSGLLEEFQISNIDVKPKIHFIEHRHILRMLEKSLARELELDKKLAVFKQNEEDLKLKLRLTEQVAACMEEATEVVWGRFLEAENVASVLMGISKEMVGRLQLLQFNLNSSTQKEEDMKSRLHFLMDELKAKENGIDQLKNSIVHIISDCSEVSILRENVKLLEEELRASESQLKKANTYGEACQEQLREMESIIESLKENIYAVDNRAQNAEAKVTQLTETNLELTEELNFLKGSNDSNTKKVSVLEKQMREVEFQLKNSRASSEVSQEQQNMLYSAIWDMETLIDELKQKVSKAESGTQNAEEQCLVLSEANLELTKELDFFRTRTECLEISLNQANGEKLASAKDISIKSNIIIDMVMQLAMERERIKNQLYSLAEENRLLMYKLQNTKENVPLGRHENGCVGDKHLKISGLNSLNSIHTEASEEVATESSSKTVQAEELSEHAPTCDMGTSSSLPAHNGTSLVLKNEVENVVEGGRSNRICLVPWARIEEAVARGPFECPRMIDCNSVCQGFPSCCVDGKCICERCKHQPDAVDVRNGNRH